MKPALFAIALVLAAPAAHALFKVVGPDGRVTYTDRPPSPSEGRAVPVNRETGAAVDTTLPFALRPVVARFPVTLFTSGDCGDACVMARSHLARRGIPYTERTASTLEERESWTRIVGGSETPTLQVGGQAIRGGFVPASWDETLDVAGYPRNSLLPPTWQTPAALPLLPPRPAPPATPPSSNRNERPEPASEGNPGGIRF
jgi:glutaredoxin